jgi:hypothetical protein
MDHRELYQRWLAGEYPKPKKGGSTMATKKTVAKKVEKRHPSVKGTGPKGTVTEHEALERNMAIDALKAAPERPSERAMRETAEVTAVIAGRMLLSAAVVKEAKALQGEKKALEAELDVLSAKLKAKETAIIAALDAGLTPEPGCPAVAVERTERITPKWKDEAILLVKESGRNVEVYEAEVRARTTPVVITRLVINGDVKKG